MTEPTPLTIYLWISDAWRHPFLSLLFLGSCHEFLRHPIKQVIISAQHDENLAVLKIEATRLANFPIRFETPASFANDSLETPCLIADPAYFFSRDTDLSHPFTLRSAAGSLSFRTAEMANCGDDTGATPDGIMPFKECLASNGLIVAAELPNHSQAELQRIQAAFRAAFSNRAFWNYRYETCPTLGSGIGSRGRYATLKRRVIRDFAVRPGFSVLDVGFGDLMVVRDLPFVAYSGMDTSDSAVAKGRALRPDWTFHQGTTQEIDPPEVDAVLCFDVLIHQPTIDEARALLVFLSKHARQRIIITGYDAPVKSRHIVYFHAPLRTLLQELDDWKEPVKVASYHDMSVYLVDRKNTEEDPLVPAVSIMKPSQRGPLVTITVNTFNNEHQIGRCLESIRRQSEKSLEVHVVDDGSTDATAELISNIVRSDRRFTLVSDGKNMGISARRNQGLRLGTGTYHLFVDGDDWLADSAVSCLLDLAAESDADIVRGSHMFYNLNGRPTFEANAMDEIHQPDIRGVKFSDCPSLTMLWTCWNNLIHRRVIADNYLRFSDDISLGEDRIFMLEAFLAARSITITKEVTYIWDKSVKASGNLSLSQNPEYRLLAIERWLETIQGDLSISRRHRELVQVSCFYEATAMLRTCPTITEDMVHRYQRVLEAMDFPSDLLRARYIKGWRPEVADSLLKVYEDLQHTKRIAFA